MVALLDVEDSSMEKGHIMMTEPSVGAFHRLKGEGECEEDKADGEKSQRRNPSKAREQASRRRIADYAALL